MVSWPRRIADVPRSSVIVPCVLALTLTAALTACGGGDDAAGAPGLGDPYFPKAGNGGYEVSHYALTLSYDPGSRKLRGTARITARAIRRLDSFHLDLKGLDVSGVRVGDRDARWSRAGQELTVRPRTGLDRGETFRTTVRYAGTPETLTDPDGSREGWLPTARGAVALGEPVGSMTWFPGNHHPADKASYDITVTVPKGLSAVSNGELRSVTTAADGRRTFAWHTAEPMASHAATLAVGAYDITRGRTKGGLPVYVAVDPSQSAASAKVLARIPEVMDWEADRFGPYPFSSTGAVVDRPGVAGYALETQNRPFFPGAPDIGTLVHELAHQWFGDSVTPASWRDMWLNEGFATYAEWLWREDHGGDTADEIFDALYRGDRYGDNAAAAAIDDKAVWAFPPARPPGPAHISDSPVYERGAMVLHRIRRTAGDGTFHDIVRGWAAAHRHGNASTADFTAYVEKQAPDRDFGEIWKDWLYGDGRPARP
ncbi:M1 family metallopeptidase [Streptomyces sp. NPDC047990]|uniref:M1 family metallopeptidase n=1 Tax=Streptomyces sp. NPDC047990 TaxID=3365496 RepID=UPI00371ABF55